MNAAVFRLTQRRTVEEASDNKTPGPATSIFKMYGTELQQDKSSLLVSLRGFKVASSGVLSSHLTCFCIRGVQPPQ